MLLVRLALMAQLRIAVHVSTAILWSDLFAIPQFVQLGSISTLIHPQHAKHVLPDAQHALIHRKLSVRSAPQLIIFQTRIASLVILLA